MAQTKASIVPSISSHTQSRRFQNIMQDAQRSESEPEVKIEDVDEALASGQDAEGFQGGQQHYR